MTLPAVESLEVLCYARCARAIAKTGGSGQLWSMARNSHRRLYQVVSVRIRGGLSAITEARLGENIPDVMGDCIEANEQLICNLLVRLAFGDQPEDFDLSVG